MSITSGFFNSLNGDRVYNADQISGMFEGLISNGVYENVGDGFCINPSSGLTVSVGSGRGMINGKWVDNDAAVTATLNAAHVTLNRYTAIVLRYTMSNREITLEMIDGEEATTPTKPSISKTDSVYELCLAYIYVKAGATEITAANIEDTRTNTKLCGFVTGIVEQVDTTELFNQYKAACDEDIVRMTAWEETQKAAFDSWFAALTEQLQVNTYIESYSISYNGDGTTNEFDLPEEYATGDIVDVYLNNIVLMPSVDYDKMTMTDPITGARNFIQTHMYIAEGNTITIRIIKSKIGFSTT